MRSVHWLAPENGRNLGQLEYAQKHRLQCSCRIVWIERFSQTTCVKVNPFCGDPIFLQPEAFKMKYPNEMPDKIHILGRNAREAIKHCSCKQHWYLHSQ